MQLISRLPHEHAQRLHVRLLVQSLMKLLASFLLMLSCKAAYQAPHQRIQNLPIKLRRKLLSRLLVQLLLRLLVGLLKRLLVQFLSKMREKLFLWLVVKNLKGAWKR